MPPSRPWTLPSPVWAPLSKTNHVLSVPLDSDGSETITAGLIPSPGAANILPPAPTITQQPVEKTVTPGDGATFVVAANGSAPLIFQWRLDGVELPGKTQPTLELSGITEDQAGVYTCGVKNTAGEVVSAAVHLEKQRDLRTDPAFGIDQLQMIAWTSISTSKSSPGPGLVTINSLRDVLARWAAKEDTEKAAEPPMPIVYVDNVWSRLMDTFETLAVASSESMQHQNFIAVARTFAVMFDRLPADHQPRAEDLVLRMLSMMGDLVLTAELDATLTALADALAASARFDTAGAVRTAQRQFRLSVGRLNSRATRVPGG